MISLSSISGVSNGLSHYWPINSDLFDYVGSSELRAGSSVSTGLGIDRFNNSNSSIFLNSSYFFAPPGVYFNGGAFTISAWIQPIAFNKNSFFFSFGNGPASDNVYLSISNGNTGIPYIGIWKIGASLSIISSNTSLNIGRWSYLSGVYNVSHLSIYLNGKLTGIGSVVGQMNQNVWRTKCYLGRSNWYPNELDASAYFDEIRIYERALTQEEILINSRL